jgi:hypothetical protein
MTKTAIRPFLISKDEEGIFRITARTTRFNSQGYPLVTEKLLDESFPTITTARAFCRREFRAEAADIATK